MALILISVTYLIVCRPWLSTVRAGLSRGRSWRLRPWVARCTVTLRRVGGTALTRRLDFLEPGLKLLDKLPVFPFELDCGKILLVGTLLVVEGEEQGFEVKAREILRPVVQGHARIVVLLPDGLRVLGVKHHLVLLGWDVAERGVQELQVVFALALRRILD